MKMNPIKTLGKIAVFLFLTAFSQTSEAQNFTQTVRGKITDNISQSPLDGVTVILVGSKGKGAISDEDGNFRIPNVPVGRQTFQFSYVGYDDVIISKIEVLSAKELILNVGMEERIARAKEAVVIGRKDKSKTNNEMIAVSGRTFSVEESMRYAGSRGDVARMAQNFAGVAGNDDNRNDIVVRGNSPIGVLYRLEGVDIPNPNHFAAAGTTGGPVSMLNNNVLSNSDFLTGAFPAEYGNAVAAVFDLQMRNGNNETNEFLGQIGFAGFELLSEGPLRIGSNSSYLVSYRYSTLGVFSALGLNFGTGTAIPKYQDVSFKVNVPGKSGSWTLFGIGGMSEIELFKSTDLGETNFAGDREDLSYKTNTGVIGMSRSFRFDKNTYSKITVSAQAATVNTIVDTFDIDANQEVINKSALYRDNSLNGKYSINGFVRKKLNSQHSYKIGFFADFHFLKLSDSVYDQGWNRWVTLTSYEGDASLIQPYAQWKYKINKNMVLNTGLHYSYFMFNDAQSLEPRLGFSYKTGVRNTLSFGYGLHSQVPPFRVYFRGVEDSLGNRREINQELGFMKSHHFVLGNEYGLSKNTRLKTEVYLQQLFDVPIEAVSDPYYSLLNQGADFGIQISDSMVNQGSGRNYGVELTLERFLDKGLYYLTTISLYRSSFKPQNGQEYSTVFDSKYAVNILAGKEFFFREVDKGKKSKKNSLTTDIKLMANGGKMHTPIDKEASLIAGEAVYRNELLFSQQYEPYMRFDIRVAYKTQGKKISQEWGIEIQNVTDRRNVFQKIYDANRAELRTTYQTGIFPIGLYRIEF